MTFYVKRSRDAEIEGPFTIEEINQLIRQKRLAINSPALPDTGQGLQDAGITPVKQWIKAADIPGYEPDPDEERNCLSIALVMLIIFGLIAVIGLIKLVDILHRIH